MGLALSLPGAAAPLDQRALDAAAAARTTAGPSALGPQPSTLAFDQFVTIDEGSFTISLNGARIGREAFSIRSTQVTGGGGVTVQARATVTYAERRLAPDARTDSAGTVAEYSMTVTRTGGRTATVEGRVAARGVFVITTQSPSGESRHEFAIARDAVVLDDDVFHQYYFVARRAGRPVSAVVPARGVQVALTVESRGAESVTIGDMPARATHIVVMERSGDQRDLWVDSSGRILKVAVPSTGIVALRDELPGPLSPFPGNGASNR
jgi:hypothetical protein